MKQKTYIVKIKMRRSDPSFVPQYVFAASARDAVRTARGQGFIVRGAVIADAENGKQGVA